MLLNHALPAPTTTPRGAGSSRSTGGTAACGTPARSPRASASCARRWPVPAPRPLPDRGRHRRPPRRRGTRRGDRLAADPRLVRRPRRPHRRPGAQGPRRGTRARGRGGHVLGAAAGRDRPAAREVLGERHRCTPSAATCTSSAATSAAATAATEAARRATNVAERDHLVRQAARAGLPSYVGTVVSLSVLHRLACPAMKCTDHGIAGRLSPSSPGSQARLPTRVGLGLVTSA